MELKFQPVIMCAWQMDKEKICLAWYWMIWDLVQLGIKFTVFVLGWYVAFWKVKHWKIGYKFDV